MTSDLATALHRIIQEIEAVEYNRGLNDRRAPANAGKILDYLKYKRQVEYWQGKFQTVKHENNMLRKKFRQAKMEKLMEEALAQLKG